MAGRTIMPLLRQPGGRPGPGRGAAPSAVTDEAEQQAPSEEPEVLCRACRQAVTRGSERISVGGAHRHTFANPHGIVFEIGCFRSAPGCGAVGPQSEEFTWFAGHGWRVALCGACGTHLGWRFAAPSSHVFFGLILERLIERE